MADKISENLHLVTKMISRYYVPFLNIDDLISVGTIGLIKGINSYNEFNELCFEQYLENQVKQELENYIMSYLNQNNNGGKK